MIRVLHLITGLNTGGAEMMLAKLVGAMDQSEFPSQVVTLLEPGPLAGEVEAAGVSVQSLGLSRGAADPKALFRLVRLLRDQRPDVIQTWLYHADLLGLVASQASRVGRVIWNIRCSNMDFSKYGRTTQFTVKTSAKLSRFPAAVVANSSRAVAVHRELGYRPRRFEVIPNGFDLRRHAPDPMAGEILRRMLDVPLSAPLVGMVARFDPQKDHGNFIQAASEVAAERPDVYFVLCGDDVDWDNSKLAGWANSAGIQGNLRMLGRRTDVARIMAALDVGVLSSAYGEGFPNVVGEAMACATPCVVTDTGDSSTVVGDTGRVVPPSDPLALAGAVLDLLNLPDAQRQELGQAARQRITDNYSLPAISARYAELYRSVMA